MSHSIKSTFKQSVEGESAIMPGVNEGEPLHTLSVNHPVSTAIAIGCELVNMLKASHIDPEETDFVNAGNTASLIGELSGEIFKAMRRRMNSQESLSFSGTTKMRRETSSVKSINKFIYSPKDSTNVINNPSATAISIAHGLLQPTIVGVSDDDGLDFIAARRYASQVGEVAGQIFQSMRAAAGPAFGERIQHDVDPACSGRAPCGCGNSSPGHDN